MTKLERKALIFVLASGVLLSRCVHAADPIRPDPKLTPGATISVTLSRLCKPGYASSVRNVPESEKRAVYREYGLTKPPRGTVEVDHLISLELGGSNDIRNLWAESYITKPLNAHVKDLYENFLHREVSAGRMELTAAQRQIATDWVAGYRKMLSEQRGGRRP